MPAAKASALDARGALLRGVALVEQVIALVGAGSSKIDIAEPHPTTLTHFADGTPLPPSLQRWLAFDGAWWMSELHHFHHLETPRLQPISVAALAMRVLGVSGDVASVIDKLRDTAVNGKVLRLGDEDDDQVALALYLGKPDAHGELPVVAVDVEDMPRITLRFAGFDLWLAARAGLLGSKEKKLVQAALGSTRLAGASVVEFQGVWCGYDAKKKRVWGEGELLLMEDFADTEPADVEEGDAPSFPIAKPVPKLSEERLGKQLVAAIGRHEHSRVAWLLAAARERHPAGAWRDAALIEACQHGPVKLVAELLAAGANPNAEQKDVLSAHVTVTHTPLRMAVNKWKQPVTEIVRALLDAGAVVDRRNEFQRTPLMEAAEDQLPGAVELLLERGADVHAVDKDGQTALHQATDRNVGDTEILHVLLRGGANVDARDKYGQTPLSLAVWAPKRRAAALALLAAGADPNLAPDDSSPPFLRAWKRRDKVLVEAMRARGRRDLADSEGWSIESLAGDNVWMPHTFEVAYAPGPEWQTLTLAVDLHSPKVGSDHVATRVDERMRAFAHVVTRGAYEPNAEASVTSAKVPAGGKPVHHLRVTMRVKNLSAPTLFAYLARLQLGLNDAVVSLLQVKGEREAPRDPGAWWLSPPPFPARTTVPFVVERAGDKLRAVVLVADPRKHLAACEHAASDWDASITVAQDLFAGITRAVAGAKAVTLSWASEDGESRDVLREPAFAALLGLLAKLHEEGTPITQVTLG